MRTKGNLLLAVCYSLFWAVPTFALEPSAGQCRAPAAPPSILENFRSIASVVENDVIANAVLARKQQAEAATSDRKNLIEAYRDATQEELSKSLLRAQDSLNTAVQTLSDAQEGLNPAERARFLNYYLNARDQATLSSEFKPKALTSSPLSTEGLVERLLLLHGLTSEQQTKILPTLQLLKSTRFKLSSGKQILLPLLHNGFVLDEAPTVLPCSSFLASLLSADTRKGWLTSLDLRTIWTFLSSGSFPEQPRYRPERKKMIEKLASGFLVLNLLASEVPHAGDLLLDEGGGLFVVKNYHATSMVADVIETNGSTDSWREREVPLAKARFMILRLKATLTGACSP